MEPDSPKEEFKKVRKGYDNYLRFSGLGLQMAGVILAGVLGGRWLDGLGIPGLDVAWGLAWHHRSHAVPVQGDGTEGLRVPAGRRSWQGQ